jgi:hypothetical protein
MANELIAPYLNEINTHRKNIRQAIANKGVDMTGVAFSGYASKIAEIVGGSNEVSWGLKSGYLYDMTSATTPEPFVVTGGDGWYFNDPYNTFSVNGTGPTWNDFVSPVINLSKKYIPTKIQLYAGSNTSQSGATLAVQGSNDNATWTTLTSHHLSNTHTAVQNTIEETGLTPDNCEGYQYLRVLKVTWSGQIQKLRVLVTEWYEGVALKRN